MKIAPISTGKVEKLANKYHIKIDTPQDLKSKLFSIGFDARQNLERHAEEMNPLEYLQAKRYLANIELMELAKGSII